MVKYPLGWMIEIPSPTPTEWPREMSILAFLALIFPPNRFHNINHKYLLTK